MRASSCVAMLSAAATHHTTFSLAGDVLLANGRLDKSWASAAWEEHELKALEHALDL